MCFGERRARMRTGSVVQPPLSICSALQPKFAPARPLLEDRAARIFVGIRNNSACRSASRQAIQYTVSKVCYRVLRSALEPTAGEVLCAVSQSDPDRRVTGYSGLADYFLSIHRADLIRASYPPLLPNPEMEVDGQDLGWLA